MPARLLLLAAMSAPLFAGGVVKRGTPVNFRSIARTLRAGETLELEAGDYSTVRLEGLHGRPDAWITIRGPRGGKVMPNLRGDGRRNDNTIEIRNCSYLAIEGLRIDGRNLADIFAINASGSAHHIRIENCRIVGHGATQQTVGISVKTERGAWGWIIRGNTIEGAGTGMYLGNSDGTCPFFDGLIERNLFLDSRGYNVQIKHQNRRPAVEGVGNRTIIRHNVFLKDELEHTDGARPNLLLGGFPDAGPGAKDMYHVYGNVFHGNNGDAQLQAEGRVSIHDNLFVHADDNAIALLPTRKRLQVAYIYHNTFYAVAGAVYCDRLPTVDHRICGNLIFAPEGVQGRAENVAGNLRDTVANAGRHVRRPSIVLGEMDFYPLAGKCRGEALDLAAFKAHPDHDRDFNGTAKPGTAHRGAYAGSGKNPGWKIARAIKAR